MSHRITHLIPVILLAMLAAPALAATITVSTTGDVVNPGDGLCSLREAISSVNTGSYSGNTNGECGKGDGKGDTIILPAGTYTLSIVGPDEDNNATGDLDIRASVAIIGAGMASTLIDASGFGQTPDRVFDLPVSGITVTLRDLTIENGHAPDGTQFSGGNGESGGGVLSVGANVTFIDANVRNNQAGASTGGGSDGSGGGIMIASGSLGLIRSVVEQNSCTAFLNGGAFGGGVFATIASVVINRSRIEDNNVGNSGGGGIFCASGCALNVSQSSITRNTANFGGAGIYMAGNTLTVANSTIAQNVGANYGAGLYVLQQVSGFANPQLDFVTIADNQGIGIYYDNTTASGSINLRNTILAGNSGDDCYLHINGSFVSQGYNFSGTGCPVGANDIAYGTNNPLRLGPLALGDDGLTYVMLPHPDSPATNAGSCTASNLFADQRGHARPTDVPRVNWKFDGCDIGAAELDDDIFWSGFGN